MSPRDTLATMRGTVALSFILKRSPHCPTPVVCEGQNRLLLGCELKRLYRGSHALENLSSLLGRFCRPCADDKLSAHKLAREKVWNELPSYFGLGTWEELWDSQS